VTRITPNRSKNKELYLICEIPRDDPNAVEAAEEEKYEAERQRVFPVEAPEKHAAAKVTAAKVSERPVTPEKNGKGKQKAEEEDKKDVLSNDDPAA
jgi:hypothetical protein